MKLVNVTQHEIVIRTGEDEYIVLPPSGQVARLAVDQAVTGYVNGIPVAVTVFGNLTGLPDPEDGVIYVASTMVAQAASYAGRDDVLSPDTGPTAIKGEDGRVKAVVRLQKPSLPVPMNYESIKERR